MSSPPLPLLLRIETSRLVLRIPTERDAAAIARYCVENRERLAPLEPTRPPEHYTEARWCELTAAYRAEYEAGQALRFYLFERADDATVVGAANFTQLSRGPFQAAFLGYALGGRHEGQGLMFEALQAAIRYVFDELNFHRIMANHLPENERSARLLARLGFAKEGYARDYLRINGAWRDHVLTALTNTAWRE